MTNPLGAERRPVRRKLRLRGLLFLLFCVLSALNALIYIVSSDQDGAGAWIARILKEDTGMVLFLCFVLFIPVLVAYVTKHPNRRSFWWKCSLSFLFPIAFFYLLMTALYEPQTKKVHKSSAVEQSEFIGEQF
jgi:cell division protein FtsW (lipid II flippase)